MTDHGNERRTAGCRHFLAFLLGLDPFFCFVSCRHVAAEADFHHVCKSNLLQRRLYRRHSDAGSELAFCRRSAHSDNFLAGLNSPDDRDKSELCADSAERAIVDALTAVDALFFIDFTETVLIVGDGVDRTCLLARSLKMDDGTERTCLSAFAALLAHF